MIHWPVRLAIVGAALYVLSRHYAKASQAQDREAARRLGEALG